jgi:hypothetical protein
MCGGHHSQLEGSWQSRHSNSIITSSNSSSNSSSLPSSLPPPAPPYDPPPILRRAAAPRAPPAASAVGSDSSTKHEASPPTERQLAMLSRRQQQLAMNNTQTTPEQYHPRNDSWQCCHGKQQLLTCMQHLPRACMPHPSPCLLLLLLLLLVVVGAPPAGLPGVGGFSGAQVTQSNTQATTTRGRAGSAAQITNTCRRSWRRRTLCHAFHKPACWRGC